MTAGPIESSWFSSSPCCRWQRARRWRTTRRSSTPRAAYYSLRREGLSSWIVDYKESGGTQIGVVMREDYIIESTRILTATVASVIQPQFIKSPKGMLLTAVQGSYRKLSGNAAPVSLQLRIEYQDVSGFQLPKRLHVMSYDGRAVGVMDLAFGTCQAQHR